MNEHLLEPFDNTWAMLLRTRKRDGSWVDTPVNVVVAGDRAYFGTPASSAKVKRLRNFPDVEMAPCTVRGRPTGTVLRANARLLEGDELVAATRRMREKYRFVHSVVVPLELRIKRTVGLMYELSGVRVSDGQQPIIVES